MLYRTYGAEAGCRGLNAAQIGLRRGRAKYSKGCPVSLCGTGRYKFNGNRAGGTPA
jgi:hypothetical protein